jgi:hypothetical protein
MNWLQLANFSFNLMSMLNKVKIGESLHETEADFLIKCGFATQGDDGVLTLTIHGDQMLRHLEGLASMRMENPFFLAPKKPSP